MATLKNLGIAVKQNLIRFDANESPLETSIVSKDGLPYFQWKLVEPINVRCSTNKEISLQDVDSLLVREDVLQSDKWLKDDTGFYLDGFIADFSVSHEECVYQETTIAGWVRDKRKENRETRNTELMRRLEERRKM